MSTPEPATTGSGLSDLPIERSAEAVTGVVVESLLFPGTGSEVPAATAAALMTAKRTFEDVGGFTRGYVYGAEDVDLCLKLRRRGPILLQGDAVLFHHESATQRAMEPEVIRINRIGNWQLFAETWGPQLVRSILRDRISGEGRWTGVSRRTVAITLTQDDVTKGWGDYYTAHELGDAMEKLGWHVIYAERYGDGWYSLPGDVDLVISLLDSYDVRRAPAGAFTLAWVRNWVDRWMEREWFEEFDLVVTSSHRASELVGSRTRYQPDVLPLATNPERFHPGPTHPTFAADYAFTGNNWGVGRELIPLLNVRPKERFLLFGKNWDQDPRMRRYWRGHLGYDLLPELYRSVKVVLDDTAGPTLPYAFLNGRVFDALASGAAVLTDNVEGSKEVFDGLLPAYRDGAELRSMLDRLLRDDEARNELVAGLRDRVLNHHTYAHRAQEMPTLALRAMAKPIVAIKVGAPNAEDAHKWGDYHFAGSLVRAFARRGWAGEIHILPQWDDPATQHCDLAIHLRGLTTYAPKPAHVNVLWVISHPEDVTPEECQKYDSVFVASEPLAHSLQRQLSIPVVYMPQATDPARFGQAAPVGDLTTEVLFVGNSRGQRRPIVDWAIEAGLPLVVYGSGWEGIIDASFIRETYFPNEDLGRLYASAAVVLNDHWPDMRDYGIVSNRVLDALASGALVVSDSVSGLDELLEGAVPSVSSADELRAVVAHYLETPEARVPLVDRGRQLVLERHTFDRRTEQLLTHLEPLLVQREADCDGTPLFGDRPSDDR